MTNPAVTIWGTLTATGTKSFVQDHPTDPTKKIVYICLEGGEAGTYARGKATLSKGKATVVLPEDFPMVTSDRGVTVTVTPLGECNGVFVERCSNKEFVVKEYNNGASSVAFYYVVMGVRKEFEDHQVIQDASKFPKPVHSKGK